MVSDDVMIAVDPHKASNTAAVLDPERVERLLGLIASGLTPSRAAGIAGVPVSSAYDLDRRVVRGNPMALLETR